MIKLENLVLASPEQMEFIIQGMRNPMNSWEKSDSYINYEVEYDDYLPWVETHHQYFRVGAGDNSLMQRLANAGTDHRKFMRMMPVYVRITAPLYWWKEFDTYKVGTVANSCSTMHKIMDKEFTLEDFSTDKIIDTGEPGYENMYNDLTLTLHYDGEKQYYDPHDIFSEILIPALNLYRKLYLACEEALRLNVIHGINPEEQRKNIKEKQKQYWWQMIQLLPSSYNQTRNIMMNYEVLANIYWSRKDHKLDEWREFCRWIESLPLHELITEVRYSEEESK